MSHEAISSARIGMINKKNGAVVTNKKRLPRAERQAQILDVARNVFVEYGYERATVNEIARRLGIVEGTVFAHFSTKRKLMTQVVQRWYSSVSGEIEKGLQGISGTENRLRFIIWRHLTTVVENVELCGVVLSESRNSSDDMRNILHELNREYTEPLLRVVKEGIASGELNADIPYYLIRNCIFGCIEHTMWDVLNHKHSVDIEQHANQMSTIILGGIRAANESVSADKINKKIGELQSMVTAMGEQQSG